MNSPDERPDELSDLPLRTAGALSEEKTRFVESMGRYFEQFGLSRIGGRLLGLLMIADEPLSLDDMATTLSVSRASISTNIRLVTTTQMAELVTKPGDRRDYYQFTQDAWGHALRAEMSSLPPLRRMATRALATLDPADRNARAQLEDLVDFCDFSIEERHGMIARWRERLRARGRLPYDDHEGQR